MTAPADNRAREFERETGHLPETMAEGLPYHRGLFDALDAAMRASDVDETMHLRTEARKLTLRLNSGDSGILADKNGSDRVLERETTAAPGAVPLWGQAGDFVITVGDMATLFPFLSSPGRLLTFRNKSRPGQAGLSLVGLIPGTALILA